MFNEPCSSIVFLSRCLAGRLWRVPGGDPIGTGTRKFFHGVYLTVPTQRSESEKFSVVFQQDHCKLACQGRLLLFGSRFVILIEDRFGLRGDGPLDVQRGEQDKGVCLQGHDQQDRKSVVSGWQDGITLWLIH